MSGFTCPGAVAVTPPTKIVTVTPTAPVERVCVESADGWAETFVFAPPHTEGDTAVQLGTGADIVAYSVNAQWGELPMTLPATGWEPFVGVALGIVACSVGKALWSIGRRR